MHILIAQRPTHSRHNNVNDETKTHATTRAALQEQTGRPRPNRLRRTCALFGRRGSQTIAERSVPCFCPRVVERHVLEKSTTTKARQGRCQSVLSTFRGKGRRKNAPREIVNAPVRHLSRFEAQNTGPHWLHRSGAARVARSSWTALSVYPPSGKTRVTKGRCCHPDVLESVTVQQLRPRGLPRHAHTCAQQHEKPSRHG